MIHNIVSSLRRLGSTVAPLIMGLSLSARSQTGFANERFPPCGPKLDGAFFAVDTINLGEALSATFQTPDYLAYRAVPSLSPERNYPSPLATLGPNEYTVDPLPFDLPPIQAELERAQIADRPDRAETLRQLKERHVFPRLLVSTHLLPKMQSDATRVIAADPRLAALPLVALVSSTPKFSIQSVAFADRVNAFLISAMGEAQYRPVAHEVFLVGGFEEECLATTLRLLARSAAQAGLERITVHILADFTYAESKIKLSETRDALDLSPAELSAIVQRVSTQQTVVRESLRRDGHRLEFTLSEKSATRPNFWPLADVDVIIE